MLGLPSCGGPIWPYVCDEKLMLLVALVVALKSSCYLLLSLLLSPPAPPDGPGRLRWRLCGTLRRQGLFDHTAQHVQVNHKGSHEAIVDLVLAIIRAPKLCDGAHHEFRVGQDR